MTFCLVYPHGDNGCHYHMAFTASTREERDSLEATLVENAEGRQMPRNDLHDIAGHCVTVLKERRRESLRDIEPPLMKTLWLIYDPRLLKIDVPVNNP